MSGHPASGPPLGLGGTPAAERPAAGRAPPARSPGKPSDATEAERREAVDFTLALAVARIAPAAAGLAPAEAKPAATPVVEAGAGPRTRTAEPPPVRQGLPREARVIRETELPADSRLRGEGPAAPPSDAGRGPPAAPGETERQAPGLPSAASRPAAMLADRHLAGAVHSRSAHLTLDTGDAGEVGLHLRIRDGVAELRVDGPVAELVEARSAELRLALSREGLALGSLEVHGSSSPAAAAPGGGGEGPGHGRPEAPEPPETSPGTGHGGPPAATAPEPPAMPRDRGGGRIHVEA